MFLTIVLAIGVVWFCVFRYRRRKLYAMSAKVNGYEKAHPVLGVVGDLVGNTEVIMSSLRKYSYSAMEGDGVIKLWLGPLLYFLIVDPLELEVVMKTCLDKGDANRFFRTLIGNGIVFAPKAIWKSRRKVIMPAFSPKLVEQFVEVFSEQGTVLARQLRRVAGKGPLDAWNYLCAYTLDSVGETVMGTKINAQSSVFSPFMDAMTNLTDLLSRRIFYLWLQPEWLYRLQKPYEEFLKNSKVVYGFTDKVIEEKRWAFEHNELSDTEADQSEFPTGRTFLDMLMRLSGTATASGYSNLELREEVLTLLVAGSDTSAVAMGFTLMMLARHPEIQDRVHQEILDVYGKSNRPVVKEDLGKLAYLDRIIKESMRLFPPVPFLLRNLDESLTLSSGKELPAGSSVLVGIWGTHRNPHYWGPTAEEFDPDRFEPERIKKVHPGAYMPFSNGPRNCLGYQYAMMSVKTALATVIRQYRVVTSPELVGRVDIRVQFQVMLKPVEGFNVSFEQRDISTSS